MKRFMMCLMTVALLLSMATLGVSAAGEAKYAPDVTVTDNGENHWWVGTNVEVGLLGDGGFTLESIDGTIFNANVAWDFTYGQLKETPYLNITIGNDANATASPYTKLYFLVNTSQVVTVKPFQNTALEHWVTAAEVSGTHRVNLLTAIDFAAFPPLSDDDDIFMFLYHDPFGTGEALVVEELYLSGDAAQGGGNTETGVESAVAVAAAAVIGAGALMVISRKK